MRFLRPGILLFTCAWQIWAAPDPRQHNLCGNIARGDYTAVRQALQDGANPDTGDSFGRTPLTTAAATGNAALLELLLTAGADANKIDAYHRTALHEAAARGYLNCVKTLLRHGANTELRDSHGHTALSLSRKHGHSELVRYLEHFRHAQKNCSSGFSPPKK